MINQDEVRIFAAKLMDSQVAGDKIVAGLINQHLQTFGENTTIDGIQKSLMSLIRDAAAAAIKIERLRK